MASNEIPQHIISKLQQLTTGDGNGIEEIYVILQQVRDVLRRVFSLGVRSQKTMTALLATLCTPNPIRARAFVEGLMEGEVEVLEKHDESSLFFILFLTAFVDGLLSGKGLTIAAMGASPENTKVGELLRFKTIWAQTIRETIQAMCSKKELPLLLSLKPTSRQFGRASQHYFLARHNPQASSGFLASLNAKLVEHISLSLSPEHRSEFEEMVNSKRATVSHENTDKHAMLIVEPSVDYDMVDVLTKKEIEMFEVHAPRWGFTLSMIFNGKTHEKKTVDDFSKSSSTLWNLFKVGIVERAIRAESLQSWQLLKLLLTGTPSEITMLERAMGLDVPQLRPSIQNVINQFSEFLFSKNDLQIPDERAHIINRFVGFSTKKFDQEIKEIFVDAQNPIIRALLDNHSMNMVVEVWVGNPNVREILRGHEQKMLSALENIFP